MDYKRLILPILVLFGGTSISLAMKQIVPANKKERAKRDQSVKKFNNTNNQRQVVRQPKQLVKSEIKKKPISAQPITTTYDLFRACKTVRKDLDEGVEINLVEKEDINGREVYSYDGKTALHHAAQNGLINMVKALVKAGADVNAQDSEEDSFYNVTSKRTALQYAVQNGHMEVVKFLIDHDDIKIDMTDGYGNGLLHHAVGSFRDNSEMVRFVIAKYPTSVNAKNNYLETPLHYDVSLPYANKGITTSILLENGADVNAKNAKGRTSIEFPRASKEVRKLLVKNGADPDTIVYNSSGWTPLFFAIEGKDMEFIELLVNKGANVHAKDDLGNTVLRYAACSDSAILKFLLENTDIKKDINVKDGIQGTPLYDVCSSGNYENAKILIEHGADVNAKDGRQFISQGISREAFAKMFYHDPNAKKPEIEYFMASASIHSVPEEGFSPLHIASLQGHDKIVDLLIANKAIIVDIKTNKHVTPLHAAAFNGHANIVEKLYMAGACTDAETTADDFFEEINHVTDKVTPLFTAIGQGKTETVKKLAPWSKVNHQIGSFKVTPLHLASLLGHSDMVKILIDNGADPKLLIWGKHTAADVANYYGKKDIAGFLTEKMDYLRQKFTFSLSKENQKQIPIQIMGNDGILQGPIIIQQKANIKADMLFVDKTIVPFGVYYRGIDRQIKSIPNNTKSRNGLSMVSNHLSQLNYCGCPKKNSIDPLHNFSENIEKEFGNLAYVFIENENPNFTDEDKKLTLCISMPEDIEKLKNKKNNSDIVINRLGAYEFVVRKNLYEAKGVCSHRFLNPKGTVGAQAFGAEYRKKEQKKLTYS